MFVGSQPGARLWRRRLYLDAGARHIGAEIEAFEPSALEDARFIAYSDDEFETVSEAVGTR